MSSTLFQRKECLFLLLTTGSTFIALNNSQVVVSVVFFSELLQYGDKLALA